MSDIELTALRAKHGDALLLSHGGARVLIDGGARGVYKEYLRPHLEALGSGPGEVPSIDLLLVSHIDSDHISGVLDLVDELGDAHLQSERPLVALHEVWHNSFADMLADDAGQAAAPERAQSLSLAGTADGDALLEAMLGDSSQVLASVGQGRRLRNDLASLAVDVNKGFAQGMVFNGARTHPWTRKGLALEVVGPGPSELVALREKWKKLLPALLQREKDREASTAAARSLDRSVFNLSSLVVIASAGSRRVLLTGDARGDSILGWLPETRSGGTAHFDIVKLPHHGSDRNVTADFFARVTADHYLVSGDGRHGNPEPAMFDMLFTARPALDYRIHLTYGPDELAGKTEFDADALQRVLDKDARRRKCLRFPEAAEACVTITLSAS